MSKKTLQCLLLALACSVYLLYAGGSLEVDQQAAAGKQPTVEQGSNGVPIVNITAPTPAGVSHNVFKEYNVDEQGIVYNNNPDRDPNPDHGFEVSKLAKEPLFINPNLRGSAASVILTEVSGFHPSSLRGHTEIYGRGADYILANPNGIYCDGCGFINANRITLTTGIPQLSYSGALSSINVERGKVVIQGKGFASSPNLPSSPLDIITRVAEISATLWSQAEVNIYTGRNQFDYPSKRLTPASSEATDKPHVAIDASLLGNVSAGKITFIATEKGVGINAPNAYSKNDITITADGAITLNNTRTNANLRVQSTSKDISQAHTSEVIAEKALNLVASKGAVHLAGRHLEAKEQIQVTSQTLTTASQTNLIAGGSARSSTPALALNLTHNFNNHGTLRADSLHATPLQHLHNQGQIYAEQGLGFTAQTICNEGTLAAGQGKLSLTANSMDNKNTIHGGKGIVLDIAQVLNNTGQITATNDLHLTAAHLTNTGELWSEQGNATFTVQGNVNNQQIIGSKQNVVLDIGQTLDNYGKIVANRDLQLTAQNITNTGELGSEQGNVVLTARGRLDNQKTIGSNQTLALNVGLDLDNQGQIVANQDLQLTAQNVNNTGELWSQKNTTLTARGRVDNQHIIGSDQALVLNADLDLDNQGQIVAKQELQLTAQNITNTGELGSEQGNVVLTARGRLDNRKTIGSNQTLALNVGLDLDNQGQIVANQDLQLTAQNINNTGELRSQKNTALTARGRVDNQHIIRGDQALVLNADLDLANQGQIIASQDLQLTAQNIANTGEIQSGQGIATIKAREHIYNENKIHSGHNLVLDINQVLRNSGQIAAANDLQIKSGGITNTGTIQGGQGTTAIEASADICNENAITSAQDLAITTRQSLFNKGQLTATNDLAIVAQNLTNQGTVNGGQGSTALTIQGTLNIEPKSQISALGNLQITAQTLRNAGTLTGGEESNTLTVRGTLQNKNLINSLQDWYIHTETLDNQGELTTNRNLSLTADTIYNQGAITGGEGETSITVKYNLQNGSDKTIASKNNLHLITYRDSTIYGTLAAEGSLQVTIQGQLTNHGQVTSGRAARLIVQGDITNHKNLSSRGNLYVSNSASFSNYGEVVAANDLEIATTRLYNNGTIAGGTGSTTLKTQGDVDNYAIITSANDLLITATGELYNKGTTAAARNLTVNAQQVRNLEDQLIFAGGDLVMNVADKIYNGRKANLLSQGNMTLRGSWWGGRVREIKNYVGTIEARRNMTLKADSIYNTGEVTENYEISSESRRRRIGNTSQPGWKLVDYSSDRERWVLQRRVIDDDGWMGTDFYLVEEKVVTSELRMDQAHIKAGGDITFDSTNPVQNYGSVITAGGYIAGSPINNETPSKTLTFDDGFIYKKEWLIEGGSHKWFLWWEWDHKSWEVDRWRTFQASKSITVTASPPAICSANQSMRFTGNGFSNNYSTNVAGTTVSHNRASIEELRRTRTIDLTPQIELPTNEYGLFRLNLQPFSYTPSTLPKTGFDLSATLRPSPYSSSPANFPLPQAAAIDGDATLPPPPHSFLIETNVPLDLSKFYGSTYFLNKVGLQREQDRPPLRFLGDPFYETRLVNEAILKSTTRLYLRDEIASEDEQVKYLIDNTATVTKDLNLAMGVALSKEQIQGLKKDILWYVEKEVQGHRVLVPQVYLSQSTLDSLDTTPGSVLQSRQGSVTINAKGNVENAGTITGKTGVQITATTIKNEGVGDTKARIESGAGAVTLHAQNNIENLSSSIYGATGVGLKSDQGNIINKTKVSADGTQLLAQASIESGGNLVVKAAKGDFINTASRIKAKRDSDIHARDVVFENQALKKQTQSHDGSVSYNLGLFGANARASSTTHTHSSTQQEGCSIDIGGNSNMKSDRDTRIVATTVNVKGNAAFEAGRHFEALPAEGVEEDHRHSKTQGASHGFLSRSSHSHSQDTKSKKVTQLATSFNIGGNLGIKSGGDTKLIGVQVTADEVDIDAQGHLDIRVAYDSTHTETTQATDNKQSAVFGLFENNKGNSSHSVQGDTKVVGNFWKVNKLKASGRKGLDTEKITVVGRDSQRAQSVSLTSAEGNVVDHDAMEQDYNYTTATSHQERQGLLGWSDNKGKKGRVVGIKLREQEHTTKITKDGKTTPVVSTFMVQDMTVESAAGKVILKGTQIDASNEVLLSGHKGVDILEASGEHNKSEQTKTERQEVSIGIKNKFLEAGQEAAAVVEATKQLKQATKNLVAYQAELQKATLLYQSGTITKEEYTALVANGALHLAAVTAATANLAAKTERMTGALVQAGASAKALGFSLDSQVDLEQIATMIVAKDIQAKSASIKGRNITISSAAGNLTVGGGSQVQASETLTLDVIDVIAKASEDMQTTSSSERHNQGNLTAEMGLSGIGSATQAAAGSSLGVSLSHNNTKGQSTQKKHQYAGLSGKNVKLAVRGDVRLHGAHLQAAETMEGYIQGDIIKEDLQDTLQAKSTSKGGTVGLTCGKGFVSPALGGNFSTTRENSRQTNDITTLGAGKHYNVKLGGKVKEDTKRDNHYEKTTFGLNAGLGPKHTSAGFTYSHAQERSQTLANGKQVSLYKTNLDLAVDTDTVKVLADPSKTAQKIYKDTQALGLMAEGVVETVGQAPKLGLAGTLAGVENSVGDVHTLYTMAKDEQLTRTINTATEASPEDLHQAVNQVAQTVQAHDKAKNPADVTLYQGEDPLFQGRKLQQYEAGYDTARNEIYLNTQGTDISQGNHIMHSVFTESQRKANHDRSLLSNLTQDQQRNLAYHRGDRAGRAWSVVGGAASQANPSAVQAWNSQHRDALALSNAFVAQAQDGDVKPRWLEHLDPRYHIARAKGDTEKARQLEQFWTHQEDKAAQAFVDGAYFAGGFGNAMANNLSGGFIERQKLTDTSFVMGQRTGDLASLLLGTTEISAGGGMAQAGGLALSAGGAGVAVGAPMTAAGLALAGHGIVVTNSAVRNLASDNFVHAKGKSSSEVPAATGENIQYKVKKSGVSGKEGAKDPPDWAKGHRPRVGESGKEFAKRLMDEKFGSGKYKTGPDSDFNKIKKWADRAFENPKPKR